jgi:uncharacterized membrane protein
MTAYRRRLEKDLDRWIDAGWIAPDKRAKILESVPGGARLEAATALGFIGALLLGVAVISFVAANWDGMTRLTRFGLLLGAFAAAAGGAAWASHAKRPLACDALLTLASLIFAAAIGLTGQIFDIAGEPRAALYGSGVVAGALALAGRSIGAGVGALLFLGLGDFRDNGWRSEQLFNNGVPFLMLAAPLAGALAWRWRSGALAHASAVGMIALTAWFAAKANEPQVMLLLGALVLGGLAAAARAFKERAGLRAQAFYGWFAWASLAFFALSGLGFSNDAFLTGLPHRVIWLAASVGLVALGRLDRHALVTAAGVLGIIGAISMILNDLGLDLMTAALVFLLMALAALAFGFFLRRGAGARS